jgi:hypothetical protein
MSNLVCVYNADFGFLLCLNEKRIRSGLFKLIFARSQRGVKCAAPSSGPHLFRHFDASATLGFNWPATRVRHHFLFICC